jgi:hypothetical protein
VASRRGGQALGAVGGGGGGGGGGGSVHLMRRAAGRRLRGAAADAYRQLRRVTGCLGAALYSPAACVSWRALAEVRGRKAGARADQQQRQRRNDGRGKSPAFLEAQGASECAGGVVDATGITVQ